MIMIPEARRAAAQDIVVAVDDAGARSDVTRVLASRGLSCQTSSPDRLSPADVHGVVAMAPGAAPDPDQARALAELCRTAADAHRPVVLLSPAPRGRGGKTDRLAASLSYLRSFGALVTDDPDVWIESVVMLAQYGLPAGPRVALVAPEGSLLFAAATALEREAMDARLPAVARDTDELGPTDVALVDLSVAAGVPERVARAMVIPVVPRAELCPEGRPVMVGLRAAMAAATAAGQLAARLGSGLGPADDEAAAALQPDRERFDRQLDKLGPRAGDHETKVLLSSWGIPVTRQAVATTASAATRVAKRAGFPVEIKPWGPEIPSEADGCPVELDLNTAADVRRAFAAVARAAGLQTGAPVIVRETPPEGRELAVRLVALGPLGPTLLADLPGAPGPMAAPAPLRLADARELARSVEATRSSDPDPDREALADLLVRVSHLFADNLESLESLELGRVVVRGQGEGIVVADARARLKR